MRKKLHGSRGIARAVVILLVLVAVMLVLVSIPTYRYYREQAGLIGCVQALDSASRQLATDYLVNNTRKAEDAKDAVARAMLGWDDLCPGGGNVYVAENRGGEVPFKLVCGLHGSDEKEVTRLNASYAFEQLESARLDAARRGQKLSGPVTVTLNGKKLDVVMTEEPNDLRRGTDSSMDYKGDILSFYSLAEDGSLYWFVYADREHAAVWRADDGWTGDSYA